MKKSELKAITLKGEDSRLQFKRDIRNVDALASEMVAFSNSEMATPPYRELGSGIKRALYVWPEIDFIDDRDGCLFTSTVHRKAEISLGKTSGKILTALKQDGNLTIPELASLIGVTERSIERNIKKLQEQSRLLRVGPAKGGHWEVQ